MNKRKKKNSAFSLLDVIFAIGIILVGLIGVVMLLRFVILAGRLSNDRFVATNLAQEGIEIVRAIRDSNWVAGQSWNSGLGSGTWQVQYSQTSLLSNTGSYLNIDSSNFYSYNSGQATKFKRTIYIYPDTAACLASAASGDCLSVVSSVTWSPSYSINIEDRLYNWR